MGQAHSSDSHRALCLLGASSAGGGEENQKIRVDKLDDGVMTMKEVMDMIKSEGDGTFLAVQVVKTLSFQCKGCGFDPWSGN